MHRIRLLVTPVFSYVATLWNVLREGWERFWFTPTDPATLSVMRIATGLIVLFVYLSTFSERLDLVGPRGWIDSQAIEQLHALTTVSPGETESFGSGWWGRSVWDHVRSETVASLLYCCLIGAAVCFTIGFFSRTANLFVLVGHLSFIHRSFAAWSGMDAIMAMILLYLLVGPTGALYSIDSFLKRRRENKKGLAEIPVQATWQANLSLRMIQIHMCIVYLCSGLAKLQGETWWDGSAVLRSVLVYELAPFDLSWLAQLSDATLELISSFAVVATLVFEIGFAFLIWNRLLRPLFLLGAVALHVGIGALMGLYAFAAIMPTGCLAFVAPETIRWFMTVMTHPAQVDVSNAEQALS